MAARPSLASPVSGAAPGLLAIGELARRAGIAASALRFYERAGLLAPAERRGGRRYYAPDAPGRLALLRAAQQVGCTLDEVRELLNAADPAAWRALAERKLTELDARAAAIRTMRRALTTALRCRCETLSGDELVLGGRAAGAAPREDPLTRPTRRRASTAGR